MEDISAMCIGIPTQLTAIDDNNGWINIDGCRKKIRLDLIDSPQVGDYVIVHAGFAIHKVDEQEALASLKLLHGNIL
jgi:hydrogenase expression/formation protein HypC